MKHAAAIVLCALLLSCGKTARDDTGCDGSCASQNPQRLDTADVMQVLAQAVDEASARGTPATIAVSDRVGNVLAVFRMNGAATSVRIDSGRATGSGLDGLAVVPDTLAAIAKAITGAYLSSEGNAFSTRTASQIVQEHFNPQERGQPAGPLFGVQFSQLPCSDLSLRLSDATSAGPKRSPLGLSADAGGFPLYKAGTVVGGVGVIADGVYGLDLDVSDADDDLDEAIAVAASAGFEAPRERRAERITAAGLSLRYSDAALADTRTGGRSTLSYAAAQTLGTLLAVSGYHDGSAVLAGTRFGLPESGYQASSLAAFAGLDAVELVNGNPRFSPIAGSDALLSQSEVTQLLRSAIGIANRTRAQIRQPLGSPAQVSVAIVDTDGQLLGLLRTRDAPVFGTDVAVQKARSAVLFSSASAATALSSAGSVRYFNSTATATTATVAFSDYLAAMQAQLGAGALDGSIAYSARALGNLARPTFPDGITGTDHGPLSKPLAAWSPFSTGVQLDLNYERIVQHVLFVLGSPGVNDVSASCAGAPGAVPGFNTTVPAVLRNGLQIFAGGVPIYRGSQLIGATGVSGDGIDQDDMIAFLGVAEAAQLLGTLNHAPRALRADQLQTAQGHLRYVQCPQAPFLDSSAQNVCAGL